MLGSECMKGEIENMWNVSVQCRCDLLANESRDCVSTAFYIVREIFRKENEVKVNGKGMKSRGNGVQFGFESGEDVGSYTGLSSQKSGSCPKLEFSKKKPEFSVENPIFP